MIQVSFDACLDKKLQSFKVSKDQEIQFVTYFSSDFHSSRGHVCRQRRTRLPRVSDRLQLCQVLGTSFGYVKYFKSSKVKLNDRQKIFEIYFRSLQGGSYAWWTTWTLRWLRFKTRLPVWVWRWRSKVTSVTIQKGKPSRRRSHRRIFLHRSVGTCAIGQVHSWQTSWIQSRYLCWRKARNTAFVVTTRISERRITSSWSVAWTRFRRLFC